MEEGEEEVAVARQKRVGGCGLMRARRFSDLRCGVLLARKRTIVGGEMGEI